MKNRAFSITITIIILIVTSITFAEETETPGTNFIKNIVSIGSLFEVFEQHPDKYKEFFVQFLDECQIYFSKGQDGKQIPGVSQNDVGVFYGRQEAENMLEKSLKYNQLNLIMPILSKINAAGALFRLAADRGETGMKMIQAFNSDGKGLWGLIDKSPDEAKKILEEYQQNIYGSEEEGEKKIIDTILKYIENK